DPLTARANQLRKYGFPRRPLPDKEPGLDQLWRKGFSRPMKVIKAELAVDRGRPRQDRLRPNAPFDLTGQWAGAFVASSVFGPRELMTMVYGQWIQPSVVPPENPLADQLFVGFWTGLGGITETGSLQLVQAGTYAVFTQGNVSYSAFTEWAYTPPPP